MLRDCRHKIHMMVDIIGLAMKFPYMPDHLCQIENFINLNDRPKSMDKISFSLLIVVLFSLVGITGDFFLKLAGNGEKFLELKWFTIGFVIYASTAFGWFYVMKSLKLATISVFYSISLILLSALIGAYFFKESLNNYEIAGIVMGILSLILMGKFAGN